MKTYKGVIFHASLPQGKYEGEIQLTSHSFKVTLPPEFGVHPFELTFQNVEISKGGASNTLIFFRDKAKSELVFYVHKNTQLLNDFKSVLPDSTLKIHVADLQVKEHQAKLTSAAILLLLLSPIILGFFFWKPILTLSARAIPWSWEKKMGDQIFDKFFTTSDYKKLEPDLNKLLAHLKPGLKEDYTKFSFHIMKSPELNAFALPGGHIVFTSELLSVAKSPEEILGVAAHEMAHVTRRHILRSMIGSIGLAGGVQLLLGDISGILALIAQQSEFLLRQGHSRENELEADNVGFEFLVAAKINPEGLQTFFKRLIDSQEKEDKLKKVKPILKWISTHPGTEERIKNIQEKIRKLGPSKKTNAINFPLKTFQKNLRKGVSL